ncbi:MAG TPA: OmpA family protein [Burkholderiales bacterium]|nr:OmpA family protein [Burkholderiales bacterium]
MRTWLRALGAAALLSGAAQAQNVTENDARSYVLSAFITGAAPAILSENVRLAPELRERLKVADGAGRNAIYEALIGLTDGKPIKVSIAPAERSTLEVDAGAERLLVRYDLQANNIAYVGLPGVPAVPVVPAMAGATAPKPQAYDATLRFGFDSAGLAEDALAPLEADKLKHATVIRLTGHADPVGEAGYNLGLSWKRAEAVRDRLVALGIDPSRIDVAAAGAGEPDRACASARTRAERIACFAPERRVDLSAELPPR